jgi:hypothetical protein
MRSTVLAAGFTLSTTALAQPIPLTQVFSAAAPPGGGPAITAFPFVDVSHDGIVAISDRPVFPRNVYLAEPGASFARFVQYGFRAVMPDGRPFNVNFGGGWAGRLPNGSPAVFGSDQEIGLVGAVVGQTVTPFFWADQLLEAPPASLRTAWGRFDKHAVSNSGIIAAATLLAGPNVTTRNDTAILRSTPAGPEIAFRSGSDPLNRPGVRFSNRDFSHDFSINSSGVIVMTASHFRNDALAGPAVLVSDNSGLRILLDQDTPMPGFSPEERLGSVSVYLGINSHGDVAFAGQSNRAGDPPGRTGIFRTGGGALELIYTIGNPVDGLPEGSITSFPFNALGYVCAINDHGDVTFKVRLSGSGISSSNDTAMCIFRADSSGSGGRIMLVAREGDEVPGSSRRIGDLSNFDGVVYLNARRQVVFAAGNSSQNRTMYAWSPSRGVRQIAEPGQTVAFDGTDAPIVSIPGVTSEQRGNYWLNATGGADGRRSLLSDAGEVSFWATFSQGRAGLYRAVLPPECLADANADGFIDAFDYAEFVGAFESGDPIADANGDGFLDFFDYGRFVEVFEGGC